MFPRLSGSALTLPLVQVSNEPLHPGALSLLAGGGGGPSPCFAGGVSGTLLGGSRGGGGLKDPVPSLQLIIDPWTWLAL